MRNSRILKLFSYIMLPIFVGILIISIALILVILINRALKHNSKDCEFRHMKINNKSKIAMDIFYQARRQIAIIVGLLWYFADVA